MSIKSLFSTKKRIAAVALSGAIILGTGWHRRCVLHLDRCRYRPGVGRTSTSWTVDVTSDTSNALLPGSGSETLSYTITKRQRRCSALTGSPPRSADSGACLGSWFTAVASAPTPATGVSIPAAGTAAGTVVVTLNDNGTNQDACKGLTSVPVTVHAA